MVEIELMCNFGKRDMVIQGCGTTLQRSEVSEVSLTNPLCDGTHGHTQHTDHYNPRS